MRSKINKQRFTRNALILCALLIGGCTSIERLAIPNAKLLSSELSEQGRAAELSHDAWDGFLQHYTKKGSDGVVRVAYGEVTPQNKQQLADYLKYLAAHDVTHQPRDAQLAYWVNLYNALTVKTVLDHYPVASIRHIRRHILDPGPWEEKRITVAGRALSLHNIEHGIVRALWADDPRIHYALNCAAIGCPNLAQRAYTAQNLEAMLEANAVAYVNHARGVSVDDETITASKIYAWYAEDYGDSEVAILSHIRRYASPTLKAQLFGKTRIHRYRYDWALNDASLASR